MIHRTFNDLISIAPPPRSPHEAGTPDLWEQVEQSLGTSLPTDYKWLINTYGSGDFGDLLVVLNPFSAVDSMNLLDQFVPLTARYRQGREDYLPQQCPFPVYPEHGGLLPMAGTMNGGDMFWLTAGQPDEWILVLYDWRGGYLYEQHPMPLVEFLVYWISGELPNSFFGAGRLPLYRDDPVFSPSEPEDE